MLIKLANFAGNKGETGVPGQFDKDWSENRSKRTKAAASKGWQSTKDAFSGARLRQLLKEFSVDDYDQPLKRMFKDKIQHVLMTEEGRTALKPMLKAYGGTAAALAALGGGTYAYRKHKQNQQND